MSMFTDGFPETGNRREEDGLQLPEAPRRPAIDPRALVEMAMAIGWSDPIAAIQALHPADADDPHLDPPDRDGSRFARHRRTKAGDAGFTLVEMVVAMVIAAAVIAGAYAILGSVTDARARTAAERAEALPGPAARAALQAWLRAAAPVEGAGGFQGVDGGASYLPSDAVSFGVEDGGALHPGPRRVRLWVESRPGRRRGLLAEVTPLRPGQEGGAETLSVAPAAAGLSLRYRTRISGAPRWVAAWKSDSVFPDVVELTVLPAPQASARADAGGLPGALRLPVLAPLRANPEGVHDTQAAQPEGVRPPCDPVGAGAGLCPGG